MADTYWLKQTQDKPLFPDVLWSRPENKRSAGKLLIVGGNLHSFASVSQAYAAAVKAGIGTVRAILPDALAKTLGKVFPEAEFASSNLSGSFARSALGQLVDNATWADGALLAGDFGKNSETAIVLEQFVQKFSGPLTIVGDSTDYFLASRQVIDRPNTVLVLDFSQLQKLMSNQGRMVKSSMDLAQLVEMLGNFSQDLPIVLVSIHAGHTLVTAGGRVSTTPQTKVNFIKLAAFASVWQLQQPSRPFETLSCATYSVVAI